jgi:hypothetical protein
VKEEYVPLYAQGGGVIMPFVAVGAFFFFFFLVVAVFFSTVGSFLFSTVREVDGVGWLRVPAVPVA